MDAGRRRTAGSTRHTVCVDGRHGDTAQRDERPAEFRRSRDGDRWQGRYEDGNASPHRSAVRDHRNALRPFRRLREFGFLHANHSPGQTTVSAKREFGRGVRRDASVSAAQGHRHPSGRARTWRPGKPERHGRGCTSDGSPDWLRRHPGDLGRRPGRQVPQVQHSSELHPVRRRPSPPPTVPKPKPPTLQALNTGGPVHLPG